MIVGTPKETFPGERRVAIVPAMVPLLKKAGLDVLVQAGAGDSAGFPDSEYRDKGASVASSREEVFGAADILCQIRTSSANPQEGNRDRESYRSGQIIIGLADPWSDQAAVLRLAQTGVQCFALELMPRITRAQAMDVLSSQATVAGYKAVLLAAEYLPRMFPMMMTAAGTISAARVLVLGAGVAGLQAIATARRLGAIVQAYDIRPAVKEQIESLGAKFVQLELATQTAEGAGGYAKAMDEAFYQRQRELLAKFVAQSDVVITTAAVPGKAAPLLLTEAMVSAMPHGSVVVDLAAKPSIEGGNCEITQPDEIVIVESNKARVLGPTNLASSVPHTASQMFSKNVATFLQLLVKDGRVNVNLDDEIIAKTLLTERGEIVHAQFKPTVAV